MLRALLWGVLSVGLFAACMREPVKVTIKEKPVDVFTRKGQTVNARAVAYDKDNLIMDTQEPIVWASSNPSVVTVDKTGALTAVSSGTATISAAYGNLKDDFTVRASIVGS